jgi:hypothetical protein
LLIYCADSWTYSEIPLFVSSSTGSLQESTNFFKSATTDVSHVSQELRLLAKDVKENSTVVGIDAEKVRGERIGLAKAVDEIQPEAVRSLE